MAETNLIAGGPDPDSSYLQKFRLYETHSYFYMIGRDKSRTYWRVLKIDRREPYELNILEDSAPYSEIECCDMLRRIDEGNKPTGGLKFVTTCYGIIGFIKFLGPYYMLLITERRKIGVICGHTVYAVSKNRMIPIPRNSPHSNMDNSENEKRYKKLLRTVDLTKDFFFSYSYNVMHSLQKNLCNNETGEAHYETMFVWNEFLTQGIRNSLKNTIWTVALVYGFFGQVKLAVSGRNFNLTLIARRSRHYAGTRYLKRGVNDKGRVANDVETEQIVFEDVAEGSPMQISSVVQNRGSIPLFWSQESSRLNLKPDIILSGKDPNYDATRLHFQNLVKRYGNPIIILNLIKTREKKPRETILCTEFAKAVRIINRNSTKEDRLRFFHLDLSKHSRKSTNALVHLGRVAAYALNLTGLFYCQVGPNCRQEGQLNPTAFEQNDGDCSKVFDRIDGELEENVRVAIRYSTQNECKKALTFQKGILRTNCIDCLDRTNVAQYAYGLVALGRQLHVLGYTKSSSIDLDAPLAEDLTRIYETMGDTLAHQYGGSAAHNKIFSQRRGQWKAATQSQEFLRTLQRYYSNAYMDAEKQNAINVFLGHFQPQQGKPALWELDSDQNHSFGIHGHNSLVVDARSQFRRSFSDGNIQCGSLSDVPPPNGAHNQTFSDSKGLSVLVPEMPIRNIDLYYSRYTPAQSCRQTFGDMKGNDFFESDHICYDEIGEECSCTNFDKDWLSSSGNSCEDDPTARSTAGMSSDYENIAAELKTEMPNSPSESGSSITGGDRAASMYTTSSSIVDDFSESFARWVAHGRMLEPLTFNFLTNS